MFHTGASADIRIKDLVDINWTEGDIVALLLDDDDLSSGDSSDSSDLSWSEEDELLSVHAGPTNQSSAEAVPKPGPQLVPSKYRNSAQHLSDEEFFEEFRINRELVDSLGKQFRDSSFYSYHSSGKYSAYDHLLIFLWFAGHRATFKTTCEQFGIPQGSLHKIIQRTMGFLASLKDSVIKWPDENEMRASANHFRLRGIPFTIGTIAVDQIRIDRLGLEGYFNLENDVYAVPMLFVSDHKRLIRHVYVNPKESDDGNSVFASSMLKEKLERLCAHYVILGDHTFPCLRNLVPPYRGDVDSKKTLFNQLLFLGRTTVIRGCLKKLKLKFPQLTHCKLRLKEDISKFVAACCVLHNLSIDDPFLRDVGNVPLESVAESDSAAEEARSQGCVAGDTPDGLEYRDDLLTAISIRRNWR